MSADISNTIDPEVPAQPLVWRRAPVLWGRVIAASLLLTTVILLLSFGVPFTYSLGHSLGSGACSQRGE